VASVLAQAAEAVKSGGRGPVSFCLMDPSLPGEVEMDTGREFPVNPQIKGAIKSLDGVMLVEEF
jgi:DNA polymerase-3 subunit alpha